MCYQYIRNFCSVEIYFVEIISLRSKHVTIVILPFQKTCTLLNIIVWKTYRSFKLATGMFSEVIAHHNRQSNRRAGTRFCISSFLLPVNSNRTDKSTSATASQQNFSASLSHANPSICNHCPVLQWINWENGAPNLVREKIGKRCWKNVSDRRFVAVLWK